MKDRAALGIITDAEANGRLRRGETIVEETAGNTGIGLTVIGMPRAITQSLSFRKTQPQEKYHIAPQAGHRR